MDSNIDLVCALVWSISGLGILPPLGYIHFHCQSLAWVSKYFSCLLGRFQIIVVRTS